MPTEEKRGITVKVDAELHAEVKQKEIIIGLIETELERDMTERESVSDTQTDDSEQTEEDTEPEETAAVDDFEDDSDEDESEDEEQGFTMGM